MALNLSPRPYNIDPTGRDYVLDPVPLLRAQEKNFQTQKETMKMVYETGRKGMEFAEYLGARQQLGRVKAQLTELDPNDPEFHRRLSAIIADNPLALENPNTAPGLKMALVPLAAAASKAQEQRYALERITETYGGRMNIMEARAAIPRQFAPQQPRVPTFTEGLLPGGTPLTDSPAAVNGASPDTYNPELTPEPRPGVPDQSGLLYPLPSEGASTVPSLAPETHVPAGAAVFNEDDPTYDPTDDPQIDGEGDGMGVLNGTPGVFDTRLGKAYMERSTGNSPSVKFVAPPAAMPTDPPDEGHRWSPKATNQLGQTTEWEQKALVKRTAEERASLDKRIIGHLSVEPQLMATESELAGKKAKVERLKSHHDMLVKAKDLDAAATVRGEWDAASEELIAAANSHKQADTMLRDKWTMDLDPEYAREVQESRTIEEARVASLQGPPRNLRNPDADITATPEPVKAPTQSPQSVADQFRAQEPQSIAIDARWTSEKVFALKEAKSLAMRLGLTEDSLIKAVESGDKKSINAILDTAQERGVISPLLRSSALTQVDEMGRPQSIQRTSWMKSKVGANYLDVLRRAIEDPDAKDKAKVEQSSKSGNGWKWNERTPKK